MRCAEISFRIFFLVKKLSRSTRKTLILLFQILTLTMFKHTTIEEFNMNLFLESLGKILPPLL